MFEYKGPVAVFHYGSEISIPTTDGEEFGEYNLAEVIENYCNKYSIVKFSIEGIEERKSNGDC